MRTKKLVKIFMLLFVGAFVVCIIKIATFKESFFTKASTTLKSFKARERIQQTTTAKVGEVFLNHEINNQEVVDIRNLLETKLNHSETALSTTKTTPSLITKPFDCIDKDGSSKVIQHGPYWVLRNYVKASINVKCHESITYTTNCEYNFLDNVIPLLESWQAPLSVALWAPGDFFNHTLEAIAFYRKCHMKSNLVQEFATFHIFFEADLMPKNIPQDFERYFRSYVCPVGGSLGNVSLKRHNLTYPINVARNLARDSALTHYVLASDIELYPSRGVVDAFFKMLEKRPELKENKKQVFVFPVFEVEKDVQVPRNKAELIKLYNQKRAIRFHQKICSTCHATPKADEWIKKDEGPEMTIFASTKRKGRFQIWEPFYIGTNSDPIFDERLSWEGKANKMVQAYIMCVLDYDFHVLSNAFLVHKPGIKTNSGYGFRGQYVKITNKLIIDKIEPEYNVLYGTRKGCLILTAPQKRKRPRILIPPVAKGKSLTINHQ